MPMHYWGGGDFPFISLPFVVAPLFILFAVWSLFWKGLALWHSARRGEHWWFVALLLINTLGILEIVYLFGFAKLKFNELFGKKEHHA